MLTVAVSDPIEGALFDPNFDGGDHVGVLVRLVVERVVALQGVRKVHQLGLGIFVDHPSLSVHAHHLGVARPFFSDYRGPVCDHFLGADVLAVLPDVHNRVSWKG